MSILAKLFDQDKKTIKRIEAIADSVEALAQEMEMLTDEQLREHTEKFREELKQGARLEDIKIRAYAVVREAARRVLGLYPFRVQIMGALILDEGNVAEMKTGEGKTLTSTLPIYLNALSGDGVHVVTVNEYLAARDSEEMGRIYTFLGLSVGLNVRDLTSQEKREAFLCDITYTTNSEIGFDYLRDSMVKRYEDKVLRGLNFTLIDEVDSILVDESRTPLIISGGKVNGTRFYQDAQRFAKSLNEHDYSIDVKSKAIALTESGVKKAEKNFKVKNLFDLSQTSLLHHINQALKANYVMQLDVEYVVSEGEIVLIDQFTGRTMKGRQYSDGLHQAIEAKENVTINEESQTLATITYQNFFRLYKKLSGMTGTAKTEEEEFKNIYGMRVIEIPTNVPVQRIDDIDHLFVSAKAKYQHFIEEVKRRHVLGQPILIGTSSVESNEYVSSLLKRAGIKHEVLNAKNHSREAEIIAKAGQFKAVTIATNMAGRGTDIKLSQESKDVGGLAVFGTERHESRRIDNQLRGRSGRQGDPGYSCFYLSFDDDLLKRYTNERIKELVSKMSGDEAISSKLLMKQVASSQRTIEGMNFDVRKRLIQFDDVLRQQREIIYAERDIILKEEDLSRVYSDMFVGAAHAILEKSFDYEKQSVDPEVVLGHLNESFFAKRPIKLEDISATDDIAKYVSDLFEATFEEKSGYLLREQVLEFERHLILLSFDRNWMQHIDTMSRLKDGIHLRAYAQKDPLQEYVREGFDMFEHMKQNIAYDIAYNVCNVVIQKRG